MSGLQSVAGTANAQREADIVFVHGLGGDWRSTWMHDKADDATFWPQWLAQEFPQFGVWSFGYAADVSAWQAQSMPLADRGNAVLEELLNDDIGQRPLVFVTHSLGGVVVKQLLHAAQSQAVKRWKTIAQATQGIVFIATPHAGSDMASFAEFAKLALRTNEVVADLKAHDSRLRELHGAFLAILEERIRQGRAISCRTYCEMRELRPGAGGWFTSPKGLMVVDQTSAEPNIPGERALPLDEDHLSICRPLNRDAPLYKGLRRFLKELELHP